MLISSVLQPSTGRQDQIISLWAEQRHLSLTARPRDRGLSGRPLCMIIVTKTMKIKLKKQIQEAVRTGSSLQPLQCFCYWRQGLVPDAQWGERGLEQEKVYCQDKQGECVLMLKILNSLTALSRKFLKAKFRVRAAGCDFLLIDCWKSTRVVLQESCAQFEVTVLSGGLSFCRRIQSYYYTYFS